VKTKNQIIFILISLLSLYAGIGFLIQAGIIFLSIYFFTKNDGYSAFLLFFTITFLIPYELNSLTLGQGVGNYLDNSFIAGLPLYICLPIVISKKKQINKKIKYLIAGFLILFLVSTIFKGFIAALFGGENVRFSWTINYLNAFLVFLYASVVFDTTEKLKIFAHHLIVLGLLAALFGLIQYIFNFYFFKYTYAYPNNERLSIIPYPDPVDLFPYMIVPFSFAINYLFVKNKNPSFVKAAITLLFIAVLFTWGRWGLFCLVLTMLLSLYLNKRLKALLVSILVSVLLITSISSTFLLKIVPVEQTTRIESENNLITRAILWGSAIYAIQDHWFVGVGIGNEASYAFKEGINPYFVAGGSEVVTNVNDFAFQSLHSFFLSWILSNGIFLVPLIIFLYFLFFKYSFITMKNTRDSDILAFVNSIICSLTGITLFWLQNSGNAYYWIFLFLILSFVLSIYSKKNFKMLYDSFAK